MTTQKNGVQLGNFEQLVKTISRNNDFGDLRFSASSKWIGGTKTEVTVSAYYAAGNNIAPPGRKFTITMDEPLQLGGSDEAPNPFEMLLAALCGCVSAGVATQASFSNADITSIEVETTADVNILGLLGINMEPAVCSEIHYQVTVDGPDADKLVEAKEAFDSKSAVVANLRQPVNITTTVIKKS